MTSSTAATASDTALAEATASAVADLPVLACGSAAKRARLAINQGTGNEQIEARAHTLEQVLEQTGEAVIVKDLNAVVTYWNREATSLYGFSEHEAVGQPLRKLHAADLSDAAYAGILDRIRAGHPTSASTERRKKSGEIVSVALKTTPLVDPHGKLIGEITVARDVTVLQRTEEALRSAQATLQARLIAICEANRNLTTEKTAARRAAAGAATGNDVIAAEVPPPLDSLHREAETPSQRDKPPHPGAKLEGACAIEPLSHSTDAAARWRAWLQRNRAGRSLHGSFRTNTVIAVFGLVLIAVAWSAVIATVRFERQETIDNAVRQHSNLAMVFQEQTLRTLKEVDAGALFIAREYARLGTKINLAKYAEDGYIDGKLFENVYVIDSRGDPVRSSHYFVSRNVADLDYFSVHVSRDSGQLFIGKPLRNPESGKWTIQMTRRINMSDGSFGGIVSMAVDPAYFTTLYLQTDLGRLGLVHLVGLDGVSRARLSGNVASFGQDMSMSNLLKDQAKNSTGQLVSIGKSDGVMRYQSFRTIPGYPLVIGVGTSRDELLAAFSNRSDQYYRAAWLVSAMIIFFVVLLMITMRRQTLAVARFQTTFEQAAVGIAHTTLRGRYLLVNQRFCEMLGCTRTELLAMRPNEILHPDDANEAGYLDRMRAGELDTHSGEKRYLRKDGSMLWGNHTISLARDLAGKPLYFIRVVEDITERRQLQQDLQRQAHHDSLTGLPNRDLVYDRLEHALGQARRRNWTTGVMFIDLDRFKAVNDTLGHGAGDQLLQQVSARLSKCVRVDDTVGRLGGDEFAVILSELSQELDTAVIAQQIIDSLAKPFQIDGYEIFISASVGITICPPDSTDADVLINNADAAMYDAKKRGGNCHQFYSAALSNRAIGKRLLEKAMRQALTRNEFVLHFQPKASLRTGHITGVEALLRWQRPDGRLVPPAEFVPLLEESGMIVPAGEWVIRAACAQMRVWQDSGLAPVPISVNLSPKQFHQQNICEIVAAALRDHALEARYLELEITESAAMHDVEATTFVLHNLKALGVRISIDDFGTGYSSLSYLKRFPLDSLKIDRSFVTDLPGNHNDASIAQAIITMAHALRLQVTAEGVENEAQLKFLAASDCDELQGYYFSRPLPAEQCAQFIRGHSRLLFRRDDQHQRSPVRSVSHAPDAAADHSVHAMAS